MQSNPQQKSYRWDETLNTTPTYVWAVLLLVCRLLPPNHLPPTENLLLFLIPRWDVVCPCIHWVAQKTKQHPFLIHASSVSTICVLLLFFTIYRDLTVSRHSLKSKGYGTHEKSKAYMPSGPQQKPDATTRQPPKISDQYSWWCVGLHLPTTWSSLKSLISIRQVGSCVTLHLMVLV